MTKVPANTKALITLPCMKSLEFRLRECYNTNPIKLLGNKEGSIDYEQPGL